MTATNPGHTQADISEQRMECMELWGGSRETDTLLKMSGLEAQVFSRAYGSSEHGGDVYYFSSCASGRISRVLLADVTGHGESVATTASTLRHVMRNNVNMIRQTRLMAAINQEFTRVSEDGGFATALLITYFSPTRSLTLSVAGHPPPLLYRQSIDEWVLFEDSQAESLPFNLPLGITESTNYGYYSLTFEPGDLLLAYTDAFTEAFAANGEILGIQGLLAIVNEAPQDDKNDFIPWLVARMQELNEANLTHDDATAISIQPTGNRIPLRDNLFAPWRLVRGVRESGQETSGT